MPNSEEKHLEYLDEFIETQLRDEFEPAREHYRKANRYIAERPLDPENSIKEVVSAIESIGRVMFPSSTTLGQVVKELRRSATFPRHICSVIEKLATVIVSSRAVRFYC